MEGENYIPILRVRTRRITLLLHFFSFFSSRLIATRSLGIESVARFEWSSSLLYSSEGNALVWLPLAIPIP